MEEKNLPNKTFYTTPDADQEILCSFWQGKSNNKCYRIVYKTNL